MVQLFSKCRPAHQLLHHSSELKRKWIHATDWLHEELDKVLNKNLFFNYNNIKKKTNLLNNNNNFIFRDLILLQHHILMHIVIGLHQLNLMILRMVMFWNVVIVQRKH